MNPLYWCGVASTFALFAAVCWRLLLTPHPEGSLSCRARWLVWGALHIAIAVAAVAYMIDHAGYPDMSEWHLCVIRTCVAGLMLIRWRRRTGDVA